LNHQRPGDARHIVSEYAATLERHQAEGLRLPAPVDALPYSKDAIRQSIRVTTERLAASGQMTDELREFLQIAYTSLADYIGDELVRLMDEYHEASTQFAADGRLGRSKTETPAWQRLADTGALVAGIARAMADEAAALRHEFAEFSVAPCPSLEGPGRPDPKGPQR
jgi:hypothetical protein